MLSSPRVQQRRSPSVLIVDDESGVRNLLVDWLTAAGHVCHRAGGAEHAWDVLETCDIDLMTLDISLSGSSGIEFLPKVKEVFEDTEVIMMTALADTRIAVEALSAGASGYVMKPFQREEVLFQVGRALERRALLRNNRLYTHGLEQCIDEQTCEIRRAHEETIHRLVAASCYRDEETGAHIRRVGLYSERLAQVLGWPDQACLDLRMAAPMHDVGKIGIPDAILKKPGKLTPHEYEIMKRHTIIGAEILTESSSPMLQLAREIALCHHERWDGAGYPAGLPADAIPESARIVAVVDAYDALTHDRVYRPALPEEEALDLIQQGEARHFDPVLLRVFLGIHSEMRRIALENPDELLRLPVRNLLPRSDGTTNRLFSPYAPSGG